MVLAQKLTVESSTAKHTVGQIYDDRQTGARYVYCVDSGAGNSAYYPVYITPITFATAALTKAAADKGYKVGVPQIDVTASYYYWCMIRSGSTTAYCAVKSATASEATLFTTTTAGLLDDLPTSQTGIGGVRLTATAATAAASATTACFIEDPEPFSVETAFDVAESMADSSALIATSAASSAMSAQSQGTSSALLAVSAASSAMSAQSMGTSAALLAVSASSSAMSAQSQATSCGLWDLAWSTFVSVVSAGSISASGASVAKASYPVEGNSISVLISCTTSTG